MAEERKEVVIPKAQATIKDEAVEEKDKEQAVEQEEPEVLTEEEAEYIQKVFFEDDEKVRLRDGANYSIPPLSLRDGMKLMKRLNEIDTSIIIFNFIDDENGEDKYDELIEILLMAFAPYYPNITAEYLEEYVDINTAKEILDIMIGLNQIKKSM